MVEQTLSNCRLAVFEVAMLVMRFRLLWFVSPFVDVWCLMFVFFTDIDTDAVESYVAEETIEFLVNVEESVVDDE